VLKDIRKIQEIPIEILPYGRFNCRENMQMDVENTLKAFKEKKIFFRWYSWNSLCLSLGKSQKNLAKYFEKKNIETVVRPTGGGILIHGWDISFSFSFPFDRNFKRPIKLYHWVAFKFLQTFRKLGLSTVEISRNRKVNYLRLGKGKYFCFLYPTLSELHIEGKKIVAMAMRIFEEGGVLLHGSIYLHFNFKKAEEILEIPQRVLKNSLLTLSSQKIRKRELMEIFLFNLFSH
jgi:lipoate-protein ligase A